MQMQDCCFLLLLYIISTCVDNQQKKQAIPYLKSIQKKNNTMKLFDHATIWY